jgi:hypothetical protein
VSLKDKEGERRQQPEDVSMVEMALHLLAPSTHYKASLAKTAGALEDRRVLNEELLAVEGAETS